ncbi:MAG: NupC/NupG family nucleoside CNT transporter [Proteobacteria bacterium]|nr:NupC/NupG family nucleoside CNT transporter [Pseudomonadota bacterium]
MERRLKPILIGFLLGAVGVLVVGFAVAGDGTASIADQLSTAAKEPVPFTARLQSFFGIFLLLGVAWGLSNDRTAIPWRIIGWGLSLQFIFAVLVLKTGPGKKLFRVLNDVVKQLLAYTEEGSRFIFGGLVQSELTLVEKPADDFFAQGTPVQLDGYESARIVVDNGSFFAFNVLPTIIFFSALMAVFYHLGIMQALVRGMAWVMFKTMGTSGAESLSAAANIFVGQTEAPLVIRPFVDKMTMSELHAIMTGGFATVAGGVMAAYVAMLSKVFPDIAGHLVAASVMSAPAALVVSKIMWPEDDTPATAGEMKLEVEKLDVNVVDAAARGAGDGMKLALNVGAMLLAFIALVAMANGILGGIGGLVGLDGLTLQSLVGYIFWPLAWAMGVPAAECTAVGQLLGVKTILNEFVAYLELRTVAPDLSYRSMVIVTYALCGFANLGSIGIQLGGIGGIAPARRSDLARIGLRTMIAGTLAAFLTANIAGTLVG